MKRHIFLILLALTFLFSGLQAVFFQADAAASRGNAAPPEALPAELQSLDVQDDFIDSGAQQAGFLQTVIGHVVMLHEDSGEAYFAAAGDAVFKHDTIFTLPDSRCRVKFTTEDVITMGENAKLGLEEYIDNRPRKRKKSIFSMLRGKAMFYAVRLFKYRTTTTTVNTPTAVVGVRGTKFGVEVVTAGDVIAGSGPIYLADASDSNLQHLLAQAGSTITRARVFAGGGVSLTALADGIERPVNVGQVAEGSEIGGTDARAMKAGEGQEFEEAVRADAPVTGAGGAAQKPVDESVGPGTDNLLATNLTDTGPANPTDILTDNKIEQEAALGPTDWDGRIVIQAVHLDMYDYLDNIFISTGLKDLSSSSSPRGVGLYSDPLPPATGYARIQASPFDSANKYLKELNIKGINWPHPTESYSAGQVPLTVETEETKESYQWGTWELANTNFTYNMYPHTLINGYWVRGDLTPPDKVAALSGEFTGTARGSVTTFSGGDFVSIPVQGESCFMISGNNITDGTFSAQGTAQGIDATVSWTGWTATVNGNKFDSSNGSAQINGNSAVGQHLGGQFYGDPTAAFLWAIKAWNGDISGYEGATGINIHTQE